MAALLARLPHDEYRRLLPDLERVRLAAKQVLYRPGEPIAHAWFPVDGVVSLHTVLDDGAAVATGLVGREGVVGLPLFLGAAGSPQRAVCQIAGDAWRLPAGAFLAAAGGGGRLPGLLRRYTQARLLLTAQAVACVRRHPPAARCAQWLLLCADRTGTERLALSHAALAQLLGVRRATVTVALGAFRRAGLLASRRGRLDLLDRPGLEAAACACYGVLAADFARLTAPGAGGA